MYTHTHFSCANKFHFVIGNFLLSFSHARRRCHTSHHIPSNANIIIVCQIVSYEIIISFAQHMYGMRAEQRKSEKKTAMNRKWNCNYKYQFVTWWEGIKICGFCFGSFQHFNRDLVLDISLMCIKHNTTESASGNTRAIMSVSRYVNSLFYGDYYDYKAPVRMQLVLIIAKYNNNIYPPARPDTHRSSGRRKLSTKFICCRVTVKCALLYCRWCC